jgi:hypothetical protein
MLTWLLVWLRYYADWRLKNFNVKKQSTIWVEWKFPRLLYKREIGRKIDELIGEQISEVLLPPRNRSRNP